MHEHNFYLYLSMSSFIFIHCIIPIAQTDTNLRFRTFPLKSKLQTFSEITQVWQYLEIGQMSYGSKP